MSTPKQQRQFRRRSVFAIAVAVLSAIAVVGGGLAVFGMPSGDETATLPAGPTTTTPPTSETTLPAPTTVPTTTSPGSEEEPPQTTTPPPTAPTTSIPVTQNNDPDVGAPEDFIPPPPPSSAVPTEPPLPLPELEYVGWFETPYIEGFTARQWHYQANGLPNEVVCAAIERDIVERGYSVTTRVCGDSVYFTFQADGWRGFASRSTPGSLRDLVYVEARQV